MLRCCRQKKRDAEMKAQKKEAATDPNCCRSMGHAEGSALLFPAKHGEHKDCMVGSQATPRHGE
jgi:deoxycytidylate deaminase